MMKDFVGTRINIWEEGEYTYEASYGFKPNIRAYIHNDDTVRDAMIVVPGGGYCMVVPHEGECVAKKFYDYGMNVFVLTYTTDITFAIPLKKQPLRDVSRAVRVVRAGAKEFKVNPDKIIICGFSAGGHVCGTLATHWQDDIDEGKYADVSNRPDGVILSYPVITSGEYTHIYSIWALIGQNAPQEEMDYFSLEKNVSDKTPPCFVWQTKEDDLVPIENSYLFAESLQKNNIPHACYVFPHGGHGLSICSEDLAAGRYCSDYTFEQLNLAVEAVKAGKGINVSEQRVAELKEQFPDAPQENEEKSEEIEVKNQNAEVKETSLNDEQIDKMNGKDQAWVDENPFPDVRLWPDLAYSWIKKL